MSARVGETLRPERKSKARLWVQSVCEGISVRFLCVRRASGDRIVIAMKDRFWGGDELLAIENSPGFYSRSEFIGERS